MSDLLPRRYAGLLAGHFRHGREMAFVAGPRQVGKTTLARMVFGDAVYLNWDNDGHRSLIIAGPGAVADHIGLRQSPVVVFDEIHKFPRWKNFLKGFYDTFVHETDMRVVVTGSARLDVYRKGGDSLMGRYFLYRMHPLSVAELGRPGGMDSGGLTGRAVEIPSAQWRSLLEFGGFPRPFLRADPRFCRQWRRTRFAQTMREDIHDISRIHEIRTVELLAELIAGQAGQLVNHASLARRLRVSEDSIRRWTGVLESLYYCFLVRPWHTNLPRSLRKEPKCYLWDWGMVRDPGARHENMVASHLLKAVHYWTDTGAGDFGLFFLRTKDKKEVDFLVSRDGVPWFLVDVKSADGGLSGNLGYFKDKTGAAHAFQVVVDAPYQEVDCFSSSRPVKVPAMTFLSQLV